MALRVIIAAGGTGGHIYPGVAVAREILRREHDSRITFVGTARGLETRIVPREGFALELLQVGALKGVGVLQRTKSLAQLPLSFISAMRILKEVKPDVVIGVGGYASGPILLIAALRRTPTMIIEPNAMPGFTNKVLARFVDAAAVSFDESLKYFRGRGRVTGNPVRADFSALKPKPRGDKLNVLIFGGSQGAHAINVAVTGTLPLLRGKTALAITHQTGENDFEMVKQGYIESGFTDADVRPFIHNMAEEFERADLLICRSGATTAAEVAAAGKAAIFIPFPFATDDHQRRNAEAFQRAGAGRMILQKELNPERLSQELIDLAEHQDKVTSMEAASRNLSRADAAERVVDLAYEVIRRKQKGNPRK